MKTGENITKRLEQRDKNKELKYIGSFVDKNDNHWHIFKAEAAHSFCTTTPHWGNVSTNSMPLTIGKAYTLCGDSTSDISISSCCNNDNEGRISGSALTINKNDIDINTVED